MSERYQQAYRLLPAFLKRRVHPLEHAIEEFVRSAAASPGERVIDAGAGEARFARYFADRHYVALDLGVGDGEWDYSRIHVRADLAAIPIATATVDTVLNIQVLEHVFDPLAVLREIHRILRPSGRLYLTAPQGWHEHQPPHDYYRFTRFALVGLLRQAGFRSIQVTPMGGYFHYLGHRLTYVPKILFGQRTGLRRWLLMPLEWVSLGVFALVLPVACYYLDALDYSKEFTLSYRCLAVK